MAILLGSYQENAKYHWGFCISVFVCVTMVEPIIFYWIL